MRKLRIGLPVFMCVLAAVIAAIANARWLPHADASASPVPVSAHYYYRIPMGPIYKTYPLYHPVKEPPGYFGRPLAGNPGSCPSVRRDGVKSSKLCRGRGWNAGPR